MVAKTARQAPLGAAGPGARGRAGRPGGRGLVAEAWWAMMAARAKLDAGLAGLAARQAGAGLVLDAEAQPLGLGSQQPLDCS